MTLATNLRGRVRNTSLPLASALLPVFEAVVNSIHAIEEKALQMDRGNVRLDIIRKTREPELNLDEKRTGFLPKEEILSFKISDNGIGFNDENLESFNTLDSEHKISKGGRGIGRLLWLKAFKHVKVDSIFKSTDGKLLQRSFGFDAASGVTDEKTAHAPSGADTGALVQLEDFEKRYREHTLKTGKAIADATLEHCLWYFLRPGGAPEIKVIDGDDTFSLSELFDEHMYSSAFSETIDVKGRSFDLVHAKLRSNSSSTHTIAYCADQRLVSEEKLAGKIPGLHGRIADENGDFIYSCYVSSSFLDESARPERTGFDIQESFDGLFEGTEISLADIRNAVIERAKEYLKDYLAANKEKAKERVSKFVAIRAPRYRPILSRIPEEQLNVDPEISDKELDLTLHKHFSTLESELLEEGHDIMAASPADNFEDYEVRLRDYLSKADDIKRSDLASYVSHRRVILDLFEKAIQRDSTGNYVREELIHQLIMPLREESTTVKLNAGNLWVVDERLAFHDFLASDKTLKSYSITGATDKKEPDIVVLNVFDQPILFSESTKLPPASFEIIEIKRPLRNDAASGEDDDPIEQAIGYVDRIRAGGVTTATGRIIPASDSIPAFCYILADLTPKLVARCKMHDLTRTADGLGFFGYKKNSQAYVEVIGFDRLLNMAKERNRAFFDKLGLPAN
jgi:hypothetical protein